MKKSSVSSNVLCGRIFKEATDLFNSGKITLEETINMLSGNPSRISQMSYLADTGEVRHVTVIEFGTPVQASVSMYM